MFKFNMTAGAAVISPTAEVCHVGDRLEVVCRSSTVSFLKWSLISESGTIIPSGTVTSSMVTDATQIVNSTVFTFTRTSGVSKLPLVSDELYFSSDNVKVSLWWTNESQHSLVMYHVYVSPSSGVTTTTSFKRANLTLVYNTRYTL